MREIRYERPLFFKFMKFDEKDFGTITTLQLGETSPFRPETTPFGEEPASFAVNGTSTEILPLPEELTIGQGITLPREDLSEAGEEEVKEIPLAEFTREKGYYSSDLVHYLTQGKVSIFRKDDEYYLYEQFGEVIRYVPITEFLISRIELVQLILLFDLIFLVLIYLLSHYFVKSSLKNLNTLVKYTKSLDFDNLSQPLHLPGPPNDEIRQIADTLNNSLEKINAQVLSLKDFISNASHELKTPLMMMSTEIDIALKKKDYPERLQNIRIGVKRLSDLLDTLSLITRLEAEQELPLQELEIQPILADNFSNLQKKYPEKEMSIHYAFPEQYQLPMHQGLFDILVKNLFQNAAKYSDAPLHPVVKGTKKTLSFSDNGRGIAKQDQQKVFERFRQGEKDENAE